MKRIIFVVLLSFVFCGSANGANFVGPNSIKVPEKYTGITAQIAKIQANLAWEDFVCYYTEQGDLKLVADPVFLWSIDEETGAVSLSVTILSEREEPWGTTTVITAHYISAISANAALAEKRRNELMKNPDVQKNPSYVMAPKDAGEFEFVSTETADAPFWGLISERFRES